MDMKPWISRYSGILVTSSDVIGREKIEWTVLRFAVSVIN
jgi:hypothetical protein